MVPDGTLSIDTKRGVVESSAGFVRTYGALAFGDPDGMFMLLPGDNTIGSTLSGASWQLRYRDAWV